MKGHYLYILFVGPGFYWQRDDQETCKPHFMFGFYDSDYG